MNATRMSVEGIEFYSINNDVNGNPRYVCHWVNFSDNYHKARKLVKAFGGKTYRAKWYGGGIVFSSYSLAADAKLINQMRRHHELEDIV